MNKIKQTIQLLLLLLLAQLSVVAGAQERVTYIHTDALGSPIAASDEDGNLIWRESYQPYGKRLRLQKGSDCPWYTGKYEEEIGLVYYGKRWYNPEIGRFYSVDPVRFDESNIHSFNRYAYANNNPYKFVDPDGEEPLFFVVFHKGTTINQAMERSEPFRRSLDVGGTLVYGVGAAIDAGSDVLNPVKGGVKQIVKRATKSARNPSNGLKLNKQLGNQQQLGEKGVPIAGAGSKTPLRDSNRLANEYGGNASDWAKRSSTRHKAPDGRSFETHWYENSATGQRVEPKTIVQEYLQGR